MSRHRIILEYNEDAAQWEWEIQRCTFDGGGFYTNEWKDIPGDDFAGQCEEWNDAILDIKHTLEKLNGTKIR